MVPWAVVPESPEAYCLLSLPVCVCVRVCFVQRRVPVTKTRRPSPASRAMVDRPRLLPTCDVSQPFDHQRGTPDDRPAAPSHPAPACLSVHLSAFRPVGAGRFRSRRRRAPLRGPPRPGTVSSVAAATSLSLSLRRFLSCEDLLAKLREGHSFFLTGDFPSLVGKERSLPPIHRCSSSHSFVQVGHLCTVCSGESSPASQ